MARTDWKLYSGLEANMTDNTTQKQIKFYFVLALLLILLFPNIVLANSITASSFVGCHVIFLNIFIGIFEGLLISKWYKLRKIAVIFIMITANYFSAIAGYVLMRWVYLLADNTTIYNVGKMILFLWFVFFITTVLVEYPFIAFTLRRIEKWPTKSLKTSFTLQGISYLCLVPLYLFIGNHGLIYSTSSDPSLAFVNNPNAIVYFISEDDGYVYQMNLKDKKPELIFNSVSLKNKADDLYTEQKDSENRWDLFAFANTYPVYNQELGYYEKNEGDHILVRENICSVPNRELEENGCIVQVRYIDYRSEEENAWTIKLFAIPGHGLLINGSHFISVALDSPFISWVPCNVTVLPQNQIVFEMGRQICILDCQTRKIGVLAKGRSPIVIVTNGKSRLSR